METNTDIFLRSEALLGQENMAKLARTRVILFGVGGVGSWCAEALIRSGVGHLTMVDPDAVCYSNINRQLPATTETVGKPKVEVLRERLHTINPDAEITAVQDAFHKENAETYQLGNYDYVIDAIDSLEDKAQLILAATALPGVTLFSSMGAAHKLDLTKIQTSEFWKVHGCPLAKALRNWFKKNHLFPAAKFTCVFSDEHNVIVQGKEHGDFGTSKGTVMHITAAFGLQLASLLINHTINTTES